MRKKLFKYSLKKKSFNTQKDYKSKYGNYSIKSLNTGLITQKHLENIRRKLSKQFKKLNSLYKFKIFIRCSLWKPYTAKPLLSRMGKGAGSITHWVAWITRGYIIMDILSILSFATVSKIVKKAIRLCPLKLILIKK